jgi:hypothetical protein
MNDLRESMWAATAEPPPTGIDLDRLIEQEHRSRRRRRTVAGGVVVLAVVSVAALFRPGAGAPTIDMGGPSLSPSGAGCAAVRPTPSSSKDPTDDDIPRGTAPVPTEPEAVAVRRLSGVLAAALAAHLPGRSIADVIHPDCAGVLFEPHIYPSRYYAQVTFADAGGIGSLVIMVNDKPYPGMSAYDNVHTLADGTEVGWLGETNVQLGASRPDGTQITLLCDNSRGTPLQSGQPAAPATVDELLAIATDPGLTLYP